MNENTAKDEAYQQLFDSIDVFGIFSPANEKVQTSASEPAPTAQKEYKIELKTSSFSELENFMFDATHPFEMQVQGKIEEVFHHLERQQKRKIAFLFMHADFFLNTLELLIEKKQSEGCVLKSDWVAESYRQYLIEGTLPDLSTMPFEQPLFGTAQQWMNLCDSLQDLYEGKPEAYIQQMIELTA